MMELRRARTGRRGFLKTTGKGIAYAAVAGTTLTACKKREGQSVQRTGEERLKQIASNSYAVNQLFKWRTSSSRQATVRLKKKYGEITLLDFPQFTKDTYSGVTAMDLRSSLFGDFNDDSQFTRRIVRGKSRFGDFDPSAVPSKRYLDKLTDKMVSTGVMAKHISK